MEKEKVRETIRKLLVLQDRDARILRFLKELNDIPGMRKRLESETSGRMRDLEESKSALKSSQVAIHKQEVEIEAERERIRKLRDQQVKIKTNEEFKALNKEIANIEKAIASHEDKALELMEQVEGAKAGVEECKGRLATEEERVKQELERLDKRQAALKDDMDRLKTERESLASDIDSGWLKRYNILFENKKDIAIAVMDDGGTCEACHMNLPPQVMHNVKGESSMVSCSFCGRLLYWAG